MKIKSCPIRNSNTSTVAQAVQLDEEVKHNTFRTSEDNPANHTIHHLNRFYTIPENHYETFKSIGVRNSFDLHIKTFSECSILIRKPIIEVLDYFRRTDYKKPVNKYVLCILLN